MGDRELLELAAKAAGYRLDGLASKHIAQGVGPDAFLQINEKGGHSVWNPLTDDGDALRLAVKLKMEIDISNAGIAVRVPSGLKVIIDLCENSDPAAVARMAIVSAAAEIGKAMPAPGAMEGARK